jgi:alkylhydroperoxidase family enzyme
MSAHPVIGEAQRALDELLDVAWGLADPEQLLTAWRQFASDLTGTAGRSALDDAATRAVAEYAEQFALDPSNLDRVEGALVEAIGRPALPDFVAALNVFDGYLRMVTLLGVDPRDPQPRQPAVGRSSLEPLRRPPANADGMTLRAYRNSILDARLVAARSGLARIALHSNLLDDAVTEVTRLRNADRQSCRYCASLRIPIAQPDGVDDLRAAVAAYETSALPERLKSALRVTDAFLAVPPSHLVARAQEARSHFSTEQIVDLGYKLVVFTANKTLVALGIDAPASPHGLSQLEYRDGSGVMTPLQENARA